MSTTEHTEPRAPASTADDWFVERIAAAAAGSESALVARTARKGGLMAPLYAHGEDETYRVIEGELTFFVGREVVRAKAGDIVVAPRGVPRTYRVESDGARWLVLTRLASVSRFEDFGRALADPVEGAATGWPDADEAAGLTAIAAANAILILGPPGLLPSDLAA